MVGRSAAAFALALIMAIASAAGAQAQVPVPEGFTVTNARSLSAGVEYAELKRNGRAPLAVHVARIHPNAAVAVRPVLSGNRVDGRLERTSQMCARVGCLAAVNGDFHHLDTRQPVGGLVSDGVMVRSPVGTHHQLSFSEDDTMSAGTFDWSARLMPTDLRDLQIDAVNVPRPADSVVLYTPPFGTTTGTNPHGAEMVVSVVEPEGPIRMGQTSLIEVVDFHHGSASTPIPSGGAVLSGHGTGAAVLADLWARIEDGSAGRRALLRFEAPAGVVDSIGGSPVLVRDGKRFVGNDGSSFVAGRHPRTIVGWTAAGDVLMVTVDGRQPGTSVGMSLPDAADLMIQLGAVEAINLDGGGSSTFVVGGDVVNRPSDRLVERGRASRIESVSGDRERVVGWVERPVSVALAVVPLSAENKVAVEPFGPGAALPSAAPLGNGATELALPSPHGDPGSDPSGALPALVAVELPETEERGETEVGALAIVAAALLGGVMVGVPIVPRLPARPRRPRHSGRSPLR